MHWDDEISNAKAAQQHELSCWKIGITLRGKVLSSQADLETLFKSAIAIEEQRKAEYSGPQPPDLFILGFYRYERRWLSDDRDYDCAYECNACGKIVTGPPELTVKNELDGASSLEYYCGNQECGKLMWERRFKKPRRKIR